MPVAAATTQAILLLLESDIKKRVVEEGLSRVWPIHTIMDMAALEYYEYRLVTPSTCQLTKEEDGCIRTHRVGLGPWLY